jgi:hypothetical protein
MHPSSSGSPIAKVAGKSIFPRISEPSFSSPFSFVDEVDAEKEEGNEECEEDEVIV